MQRPNECVFLVSSAINAKFGVFDKEERLNQTIETCKSIKEHAPADVIVLDNGVSKPSAEDMAKLEPHIEAFVSYSEHPTSKMIHEVDSWDIVKNMNEILMYGIFFENAARNNFADGYKRIFKMSGRYRLNENFNYDTHYNADNKIIIRGPFSSQFSPQITGGVTQQYMSRLWSFDPKLISYVDNLYRKMFSHMQDRLNSGGYIDIEHLLFAHIDPDLIQKIDKIGLEGQIAPNGQGVSD